MCVHCITNSTSGWEKGGDSILNCPHVYVGFYIKLFGVMGQWGLGRYMGTPDRWVCDGDTLFVHEKKLHTPLYTVQKLLRNF
jgi:hypothetical protein